MNRKFLMRLTILAIAFITAAGCTNKTQDQQQSNKIKNQKESMAYKIVETKSVKAARILGIGYPGNDTSLYTATTAGIRLFKLGKSYETTGNHHEYMGFQAINSGFIASGHPQRGTGYKDPLGLVQSSDKGKTLKKLALYGAANFHFIGTSFYGNVLYVINEEANNQMDQGFYYSKDKGKTWKQSALHNFNADSMGMIAVHPKNGDIMAMSTRTGIYYSVDNGNTMKPITSPVMATALTFTGDSILYSSVEEKNIRLKKINPSSGSQVQLSIPFLDYDNPITYIAVNPKNSSQFAFSTYKNDLYESMDGGKNWTVILQDGKK